jgi:hypothetical protein
MQSTTIKMEPQTDEAMMDPVTRYLVWKPSGPAGKKFAMAYVDEVNAPYQQYGKVDLSNEQRLAKFTATDTDGKKEKCYVFFGVRRSKYQTANVTTE